ncbi:MAG: MerR family transcriptional regulator [Hyphomonas sp.]|nr:MerR family transcriptional regulator [Hyphomonas sp.]
MKSIGRASKESGVGIETIRYYEREGIVPPPSRTANGRRQFSDQDISQLKFVRQFRSLGFPIADIQNLQRLAFSANNSCDKAALIGRRNLDVVRKKIADLEQIERALELLVRQCEAYPEQCPMLRDLQQA